MNGYPILSRDYDVAGALQTESKLRSAGRVDLNPALRETVILAMPQARVCSETCRGYCSQCGADLNRQTCTCAEDETDPRWEGLPD